MPQQTWLITGCSSGFGIELARQVLLRGHQVVATSRNPNKTAHLVREIEDLGGRWMPLDVTSASLENQIQEAYAVYGSIDVLVNNAGFSLNGGFEDLSLDDLKQQYDTNVYGVFRTMKAVLPDMRTRRSGTVINISSTSGLRAVPGVSLYASSKYALEGLTEAVAQEYADFGIRICLIEPGPFRTNFLGKDAVINRPMSAFYKDTVVERTLKYLEDSNGKQPGDPVKAAEQIVDFALGTGQAAQLTSYLRLPLGSAAVKAAQAKIHQLQENLDAVQDMAARADY